MLPTEKGVISKPQIACAPKGVRKCPTVKATPAVSTNDGNLRRGTRQRRPPDRLIMTDESGVGIVTILR